MLALFFSLTVTAQVPVAAASQNELVIGIDFDGQSFTGDDPLDPGTGITPAHTAGDDDSDNDDALSDDVTNGNDGDEDDHDVASITVAAASSPSTPLAFSGSTVLPLALFAGFAIALGAALLGTNRRRRN